MGHRVSKAEMEAEMDAWLMSAFPDAPHGIREAARWGFDAGWHRGLRAAGAELPQEQYPEQRA